MPPHLENDVLGIYSWARFYSQKKDFLQANCGDRGDGKSTAALAQAELYDSTSSGKTRFRIKRCVFAPSNFLELVRSDLRPGSYIVWDETGLELSSRRWYSLQNFVISGVVQSMRFKRLGAIFTYPHFDLVDKNVRKMFQAYVEMRRVFHERNFSEGIVRLIHTNAYTGDMYPKNMRWYEDTSIKYFTEDGEIIQIPFRKRSSIVKIWFQLPSPELVEEYEPIKKEATDSWYSNYGKQISVMKELALDEKTKGKKMKLKEVYEDVKKNIDKYISPKSRKVDSGKILMDYEGNGLAYPMAAKITKMLNDEIFSGVLTLKKTHGTVEAEDTEKKEVFDSVERRKKEFLRLKALRAKRKIPLV